VIYGVPSIHRAIIWRGHLDARQLIVCDTGECYIWLCIISSQKYIFWGFCNWTISLLILLSYSLHIIYPICLLYIYYRLYIFNFIKKKIINIFIINNNIIILQYNSDNSSLFNYYNTTKYKLKHKIWVLVFIKIKIKRNTS
jgi:hypothetical protein